MARRKRSTNKPTMQESNAKTVASAIVNEVVAKDKDAKDPDEVDDDSEDGKKDRKRRQAAFKKFIKVKGKKDKAKK